jgi:hypothetical protein
MPKNQATQGYRWKLDTFYTSKTEVNGTHQPHSLSTCHGKDRNVFPSRNLTNIFRTVVGIFIEPALEGQKCLSKLRYTNPLNNKLTWNTFKYPVRTAQ